MIYSWDEGEWEAYKREKDRKDRMEKELQPRIDEIIQYKTDPLKYKIIRLKEKNRELESIISSLSNEYIKTVTSNGVDWMDKEIIICSKLKQIIEFCLLILNNKKLFQSSGNELLPYIYFDENDILSFIIKLLRLSLEDFKII